MDEAKKINYVSIILATSAALVESIDLYNKLGFYRIPPYYDNPYLDAIYFRVDLESE